jgi:hypothetical protein
MSSVSPHEHVPARAADRSSSHIASAPLTPVKAVRRLTGNVVIQLLNPTR